MGGLFWFNVVLIAFCAATAAGFLPRRLYDGFLRGLHNTIGITTPTDRQLRWVLIAWVMATLVIVDGLAGMLVYVF